MRRHGNTKQRRSRDTVIAAHARANRRAMSQRTRGNATHPVMNRSHLSQREPQIGLSGREWIRPVRRSRDGYEGLPRLPSRCVSDTIWNLVADTVAPSSLTIG